MTAPSNWLANREYLLTKESELRQYNQQVQAFKANPQSITDFERIVDTHSSLPLPIMMDAWASNQQAGSADLYQIEDELVQERIRQDIDTYRDIYNKYTPEDIERNMTMNLGDLVTFGFAPGGAAPGDVQYGVWGALGLEWLMQTFGPSGKINVLGYMGNAVLPGQPFLRGRAMEYYSATRTANKYRQEGMSMEEIQSKLMIDLSETGLDLGNAGRGESLVEAFKMSGQTNLGALWNAVAKNGVLPGELRYGKYRIPFLGKVDDPVNFDRNTIIGFQPVIPKDTEIFRYYKQMGYSDAVAEEKTINAIGQPLKRRDANGELFYTSLAKPNRINFFPGRFDTFGSRKYALNTDNNHPSWSETTQSIEYSPGKVYAAEVYEPGTVAFNFLSGAIDFGHQLADPLFYSKWGKGLSVGKKWRSINKASQFLDEGVLVMGGKKGNKLQINNTKLIENVYENLGKLDDLDLETTRNFKRFNRLFGRGILSEAKSVRSSYKKAKEMRRQMLIFGRVNRYLAPTADNVFDMPVWNKVFDTVAESGLDNFYALSKMPLFRNIHPDLLAEVITFNKADDVKNWFKVYTNTGHKVVNSKVGTKGTNVKTKQIVETLSDKAFSEVGQSGFINNMLIQMAKKSDEYASTTSGLKKALSKPLGVLGNQDAAYRNLGSYIGQGARGLGLTASQLNPFKTKKRLKVTEPTVESLTFDKAEAVGTFKAKLKDNFTDYGEYDIQKYLGFGGAYKTYNEPYLNNLLGIVPDSGLVITNKKRAFQNLLAHLEINGYTEKEASKWALKFVNLDYTNKPSIYKFGRELREWELKNLEKIIGEDAAMPLRRYMENVWQRLERSKIYANAKSKNLPGFNSKNEVHEVVLAENSRDVGKFRNVGTMNALFLSQMTDSVVPLIPYQYLARATSGIWQVMPDPQWNTVAGTLIQDAKVFKDYIKSWGKEGANPWSKKGYIPRSTVTDPDVVTRAMDYYTRRFFKPLVLLRLAFLTRVFLEEQTRMFVKGLSNVYGSPIDYMRWLSTGKKMDDKKLLELGFTPDEIENLPDIQSLLMSQELLEATQQTMDISGFLGTKFKTNPLNLEYRIKPKKDVSNAEYTSGKLWDYIQIRTDPIGRKVAQLGWGNPELNKWLDSAEGMFWREQYADYSGNYDQLTDPFALDQYIQQVEGWIREVTGDNIIEGLHFVKRAGKQNDYVWRLDKAENKGSTILRNIISEGKIPVVKDGKIVEGKFVDFMSDLDNWKEALKIDSFSLGKSKSIENFSKRTKIKGMSKNQRGKAIEAGKKIFASTENGGLGLNGNWVRMAEEIDPKAGKKGVGEFLDEKINSIFDFLMRKPIGYLNRSPVFKQFYWLWIMDNINNMDKGLQTKYIKLATQYRVPKKVVAELKAKAALRFNPNGFKNFDEMDGLPRAYALENLKDLLYDTTLRHKISDTTRNVFPFPEIWFEIFKTWGKLLAENPYPAMGVAKTVKGLNATEDVSQVRTGWFAPNPKNDKDDIYITPLEAWMGPLLVEGNSVEGNNSNNMIVQYRSTTSSVNLLAQSQVPGTNTLVSWAINKVLPDRGPLGDLKNWLSSFPMPNELEDVVSVAPQWKQLAAFVQGMDFNPQGFFDENIDIFNIFEFSQPIKREPGEALGELEQMRADATIDFLRHAMVSGEWLHIYEQGWLDKYLERNVPNWNKGDETYEEIENAMVDYARDRSQVDFFMRFIRGFIGPSAVYKPEYFIKAKNGVHYHMSVLYGEYEKLLEKNNYDYTQTSQDFHSIFGLEHAYIFSPTDIKVSGKQPKTKDAIDFWAKHPTEKEQLSKSYYFLYPDNPEADTTWLSLENERYQLTPDEYQRFINKTIGFYRYNSIKDDLDTLEVLLKELNKGELTAGGRQRLEKIARTGLVGDLAGFQRDEYGFISLPDTEDIWNEITTEWGRIDLVKETDAGKFYLGLKEVWDDMEIESIEYMAKKGKAVSTEWWRKNDDPQAVYFRMTFDAEAKRLLTEYPDGFQLYFLVVLRLLNDDVKGFDAMQDEQIDEVRYGD